ncbi:MAG TPA: diphosphomevalonate decarboxylase [Phototrophicaceae bacterium]|nr:diphosphomevalonate decarboxylase [Phototrophicaceae bacterium]
MSTKTATARANPNLAFIKYWGNADDQLRLPANSSLSMNLDGLYTQTTVTWRSDLTQDELVLNGQAETGKALQRVAAHLDALRQRLKLKDYALVESQNNFPMGTGIASSASSFAALTVAAAAGQQLSERELSTLARLGSGSAARSVPTGFVEWHAGETHEAAFAESVAPPEHWDLVDVVAVVSRQHKVVSSKEGHPTAATSDLQAARVAGAAQRLKTCKEALLARDFSTLAEVIERDSNLMHAVMMTSRPPLFYWLPPTLAIMEQVRQWRADGWQVCYTLDAGPNVHCVCVKKDVEAVKQGLSAMPGVVEVLVAGVGGPAHRLNS